MMKRMQDRGQRIRVRLYMEAMNYPDTVSYNVVGEIPGSEFPHQVVIIGAHLDSWDVGTGSMDDGGGVMIAWQVLSIVKKLGLRPRRTLRLVLWTAEEQGVIGSTEYFRAHNTSTEINNVSIVIESDDGAFKPKGIGFTGSGLALSTMEEIMRLLTKYNTSQVKDGAGESADTGDWIAAGVPGVEILNENENYFYYHHTHADTMTVQDADDLDMCTVVWATVAYVVASLDDLLPRTGDYVVSDAAGSQLHYTSAGSLSIILVLAAVATWFISTGS
jgi:carboxypeptidase Q